MNIAELLMYLYPDSEPTVDWVVVSESGVQRISDWNMDDDEPSIPELEAVAESSEFVAWISERQTNILDAQTGAAIDTAIHPTCGIDEQLGILRDQITRILNGDMTPSEDFTRLNEIAIAEIERAQLEKTSEVSPIA